MERFRDARHLPHLAGGGLAKLGEKRFRRLMNSAPRAFRFCNLSSFLSLAIPVLALHFATQAPVVASDAVVYPLKTCVVTDEKLGSMGKAYVHSHEGQEVQFCCKSCVSKFNKDPQKYLKKVADAAKLQAK